MKLTINLQNYPQLMKLYIKSRGEFQETMQELLSINIQEFIENKQIMLEDKEKLAESIEQERKEWEKEKEQLREEYEQRSIDFFSKFRRLEGLEAIFKMPFDEFLGEVHDAFMDYKGVLEYHHSHDEKVLLALLEHENNPLVANRHFTIKGDRLTKEEFFGMDKVSVKEWLQSLLYAGKYLSHVDLVHYLQLGEFHLVENMQNEHIQELIKIQPALAYQKEHNIPLGKRVEGTGYFDLGEKATKELEECPACHSEDWNTRRKGYVFCKNCKGGGYK